MPKNYETSQYVKRLPYIANKGPDFDNRVIDLINNMEDLKKWLLAMSEYGNEIQEDLNAIVGYDEKFNNAIVRHALDLKNSAIFRNLNLMNVTFRDVKKFRTRSTKLDDDDDNSGPGAGGVGGSEGSRDGPPRPGETEELNSRLNAIRSDRLTSSFIPSTEPDPDENVDMQDILNNRLND